MRIYRLTEVRASNNHCREEGCGKSTGLTGRVTQAATEAGGFASLMNDGGGGFGGLGAGRDGHGQRTAIAFAPTRNDGRPGLLDGAWQCDRFETNHQE